MNNFDLEFPDDGTILNNTENIANEIMAKIEKIKTMGLTPEFILVNKRNYEKLITWNKERRSAWTTRENKDQLIDELFGCKIIIWDVPINYINIRCKASVEYLQNPSTR